MQGLNSRLSETLFSKHRCLFSSGDGFLMFWGLFSQLNKQRSLKKTCLLVSQATSR